MNKNNRGFSLIEILIVIVIAGLGLMTVAPRLAENTILTDKSEKFFREVIDSHLKTSKELNRQIYIKGFKGSSRIVLHDETSREIPAGDVSSIYINGKNPSGLEYRIYFYPDGIFDQFTIKISGGGEIESYPAINKVVHR